MVQDLSFLHLPDVYPRATRQRLRRLVSYQTKRASAVLTVSEFCRRDLIDSYGLDPLRVHVVPNTVEAPRPLTADRRDRAAWPSWPSHGVDSPFLLYLGNLHPRKNVAGALRAFAAAQRRRPGARRPPVRGGRRPLVGLRRAGGRPGVTGRSGASSSAASTTTCASSCSSRPTRWCTCRASRASACRRSRPWPSATPVLAGDAGRHPRGHRRRRAARRPRRPRGDHRRHPPDRDRLGPAATSWSSAAVDRVAHYDLVSTGMAARAALGDAALASVPR